MTADGAQAGASAAFRAYLEEIGRNLTAGNATEHTHRPVLQQLVQALDPQVRAVNEPKRVECGAPDYIVTRNDLPVGYIEAKDVGRSLDEIERDEQLKRYRESLSNLILTDYLEFRWYKDGEKQQTARIAYIGDSGALQPDREGQKQAAVLFSAFLAQQPPIVGTPEDLAKRMAALTRIVRDLARAALKHDRKGGSQLCDQLEGFRRVLIHDLGEEQFADMYAQTIAYGLFAARVNAPVDEHFSRQHAAYDLPKTNPFLRQMFGQIAGPELDDRITWAVDDLAELLARARMDLVLADFGKRTRQEDPVVHFYETFLKAYDPKMREARGVYYTPEPVVSYIVRSVDHILRTEFGLPDGLADNSMIEVPVPGKPKETRMVHRVQILDPACGTGTFLAQVIETIRETVVAKHGAGMWPGYVHDHLLPRLYGFELLMAPYAIAHLKLGLRLKETGYDIEQSERLRVYLTNSLEEAHEREHGQLTFFGTWLAEEADRASEVKRELPIMIVLGNPPYSGHSVNQGDWIVELISAYKEGCPELSKPAQAKWLSDDYVKFLRFGQWRIERTGHGVLAMITNHGYLDNPTFRGMRESLLRTFDEVNVLNLGGSSKRGLAAAGQLVDENVFDIQQGVAISLMTRRPGTGRRRGVLLHSAVDGRRIDKYDWLLENDVTTTNWSTLRASPPLALFVPVDESTKAEYEAGWSLRDLFNKNGDPAPGIVTTHDQFAISWTPDEAVAKVESLLSSDSEAAARGLFRLCSQNQWSYARAKRELAGGEWRREIKPILYRPFDTRWTVFNRNVAVHRRERVMRHMLDGSNLGLCTNREVNGEFRHVLCTRGLISDCTVSPASRERTFLFPLWLRPKAYHEHLVGEAFATLNEVDVNLNPAFLAETRRLNANLAAQADVVADAEAAFSYIYAVLHSASYRHRYQDHLRSDFPRVPLTSDGELFRELCRLGWRLVTLHLMESGNLTHITTYPIPGDNRVDKLRYSEPGQGSELGRVWINGTQHFEGVQREVWEFHIGGYQVCAKWLKDREGRLLTYDDLAHYQYVVASLAETIALMREIDEVIDAHGGWPLS